MAYFGWGASLTAAAAKATRLSVQQSPSFRRDFEAAAGTDEVGAVLAREAAATTEAASIGVECRPRNVIGVKDQQGTIEVDLESSLSHPR
ncbi:hypothetical protein ACFWFI_26170 [Streptomyces sp. NPDC060209]|uniref:hypothetical protein n=1 Tax=Streptomyces sp. NPDC060209 TaxID=3347073 RepID=UPI003659C0EF